LPVPDRRSFRRKTRQSSPSAANSELPSRYPEYLYGFDFTLKRVRRLNFLEYPPATPRTSQNREKLLSYSAKRTFHYRNLRSIWRLSSVVTLFDRLSQYSYTSLHIHRVRGS